MSSKSRNKGKTTENKDEPKDTNNVEIDEGTLITQDQLNEIILDTRKQVTIEIRSLIQSELKSMHNEIVNLQTQLETSEQKYQNAEKEITSLKKELSKLQDDKNALSNKLDTTNNKLSTTNNELNKCIDTVEDHKNRQLRKTLVFRGIEEQRFPDDHNRKETWEETAELLAEAMAAKMENVSVEDAAAMVERCHRSNPNPQYQGNAPRPIFAAFCNWKDSEKVKKAFREANVRTNAGSMSVIVENKFGPRTTVRRNYALKERKRLKEEGRILSGYVAFPARLMVKEIGFNTKYRMWKDFSNDPVSFNR